MRTLLLLALLAPGVVMACLTAQLVAERIVDGGIICTYELSDGTRLSVLRRDEFYCPVCLE